MDNHIPNPPAVIDIAQPEIIETFAQKLFREQGGDAHQFAWSSVNDYYNVSTVADYKRTRRRWSDLDRKVIQLEELVKEWVKNGDTDVPISDIVDIFGFEMTRTVDFTVSVEFTGSLTVPMHQDIGEAIEELSFDMSAYYAGDVELGGFDSVVQSADWHDA